MVRRRVLMLVVVPNDFIILYVLSTQRDVRFQDVFVYVKRTRLYTMAITVLQEKANASYLHSYYNT